MKFVARVLCLFVTGGLLVGLTTQSVGQRIIDTPLRSNPNRTPSGSCVFDRDGKLVHAPAGVRCADRSEDLQQTRRGEPPLVEAYLPALRGQLSELVADHAHIAAKIASLQKATNSGRRELALEIMEKLGAELTDHRVREERLLDGLAGLRTER